MEIRSIHSGSEPEWVKRHGEILDFVGKFGSKRISPPTRRSLLRLSAQDLNRPGTSLLLATVQAEDGPRIAGVSCITGYGDRLCTVVVHPLYRGRGLGSKLLAEQLHLLGRLSCRVSLDHVSSLQMCFRAGLSAKRLIKVRGGRPCLLLENNTSASAEPQAPAANFLQGR